MVGDPLYDPSSWRLATPDGIPYKLKSMSGGISQEDSSAEIIVIVEAANLYDLGLELFPPPLVVGGAPLIAIPVQLGGFVNLFGYLYKVPLFAKKLTWKPVVDGLPVDPFNSDLTATPGTYKPCVECTVSFEPLKVTQPNQDPKDFIEISGKGTKEYTKTAMPNAKIISSDQPLKTPAKEFLVLANVEKWELKFPLLAASFAQQYVGTLRQLCGKVNQSPFSFLGTSPAETLRIDSYDYDEKWTWSHGNTQSPPVQITVHIEEMYVPATDDIGGIGIGGWNHEWTKNGIWQRCYADGSTSQLKCPLADFSNLIPF
jgi:hypothetical protein